MGITVGYVGVSFPHHQLYSSYNCNSFNINDLCEVEVLDLNDESIDMKKALVKP